MDFFDKTGKVAIGSRLRRLTDRLTSDSARIYEAYGLEIRPKWFPVLSILANGTPMTVTAIAREIGQSHPSVSNILKELKSHGYVTEIPDDTDRRRSSVALSPQGKCVADSLYEVCSDVEAAVNALCAETTHDLWRAIGEWEYMLDKLPLSGRVEEQRRQRERQQIEIVDYTPEYRQVFRQLNEMWITEHWQMEEADYKYLDHPEEHILEKGGHILVALYRGKAAGVCALMKMNDGIYDYELAKYAVNPDIRGKGIGQLLGEAAIEKARALGARKLFLESNTILRPAIHIYRKLGFRELKEYHPAYERGDIQMELSLE